MTRGEGGGIVLEFALGDKNGRYTVGGLDERDGGGRRWLQIADRRLLRL